jgi:hypothetical protein
MSSLLDYSIFDGYSYQLDQQLIKKNKLADVLINLYVNSVVMT